MSVPTSTRTARSPRLTAKPMASRREDAEVREDDAEARRVEAEAAFAEQGEGSLHADERKGRQERGAQNAADRCVMDVPVRPQRPIRRAGRLRCR